jgi:hypothetical protein
MMEETAMVAADETNNAKVRAEGERLFVEVPWDDAENFQSRLQQQGIGSILFEDAGQRRAHLELRPGTDQAALSKALADGGG